MGVGFRIIAPMPEMPYATKRTVYPPADRNNGQVQPDKGYLNEYPYTQQTDLLTFKIHSNRDTKRKNELSDKVQRGEKLNDKDVRDMERLSKWK